MSQTMTPDPWAPVKHEDYVPPTPKPRPRPAAQQQDESAAPPPPAPMQAPAPQQGGMMPTMMIPMGLNVPPDLLAALNSMVQSQAKLTGMMEQVFGTLGQLTTKMDGWMEAMEGTMLAASQDAMTSQDTLGEQIRQQAEGTAALAAQIGTWSKTIETAILAPRRVSLERGKDGMATAAVSTPSTTQTGD